MSQALPHANRASPLGTIHQVSDNCALPFCRGFVVRAEATGLGPEGAQCVSLGSHVGTVVGNVYQFVESGEDEAPADGVENITVDLGGKGNRPGSPTGLTHMMGETPKGNRGA